MSNIAERRKKILQTHISFKKREQSRRMGRLTNRLCNRIKAKYPDCHITRYNTRFVIRWNDGTKTYGVLNPNSELELLEFEHIETAKYKKHSFKVFRHWTEDI